MSVRHAVILAGGKGTRLRPYTTSIPSRSCDRRREPILEIVLRQLARDGFKRVTIAIGLSGADSRLRRQRRAVGLEVDYATEAKPLSTIGPVVAILDKLPEQFLVLNGDILTDLSFLRAAGCPFRIETRSSRSPRTTAMSTSTSASSPSKPGRVVGFVEKPTLNYQVSWACTPSPERPWPATRRARHWASIDS